MKTLFGILAVFFVASSVSVIDDSLEYFFFYLKKEALEYCSYLTPESVFRTGQESRVQFGDCGLGDLADAFGYNDSK